MSKPAFKARFAKRLVVEATGALLLTGVAAGTASASEPSPPPDPSPTVQDIATSFGQQLQTFHPGPDPSGKALYGATIGFLPNLAKSGEAIGQQMRQEWGPGLGIGALPSGG